MSKKNTSTAAASMDVVPQDSSESWLYSDTVKEHFFHPKNLVIDAASIKDYDGVGMIGSPACGDMMKMWIWIDKQTEKIKDLKWQTFGCASAIGATSMLSVMATENGGLTLEQAANIKPQDITARLGGLPTRKIHCSVLGDKALRSAINNYFLRSGQKDRIIEEQARVIDKQANVTDHDIEEAVLEGAVTLEAVQKKTKAGVGNPSVVPEIEQLIRFYKEKYFG